VPRLIVNLVIACSAFCAVPAGAQQMLSATDYKAAYCVGRLRDIKLPQYLPTDSQIARDLDSSTRRTIESARSRLRAYILPRMGYLDSVALIATINVGVRDQVEYVRAAGECWTKANSAQSISDAMKIGAPCMAGAGWPKLKECEEAQFLPF
jgi:hypothetical protein